MALKLVLEPIFESDFYPSSYAYRPARRTQDAIAEIVHFTKAPSNYEWVIETEVLIWHGEKDRNDPVAMARVQERRLARLSGCALVKAFCPVG